MKKLLVIFWCAASLTTAYSQPKINFDSLIRANTYTFSQGPTFSGKGWDQLLEKAKRTNYVLIGEDHFTNEIPMFTRAFAQQWMPANYICEVDPWMMNIFSSKINSSTNDQLNAWIASNYNGFSFFQKKPEFELMTSLLQQKTRLCGIEQVGLMSTTILYQYLMDHGAPKNRNIYQLLRDSSTAVNNRTFADLSKPFFMLNPFFQEKMDKLDRTAMKSEEKSLVDDMLRSASIYKTGSHRARIKLMQQNLMALYPTALKGKKSLFKFGANHTMKGESYLPVYDIGTTAHILAQAENQDSFHVIILPKSGQQAGFLGGSQDIDFKEGIYLALQPLFVAASSNEWSVIDLEAVRAAIRKAQHTITDEQLRKTIFGYDALVVFPKATPAQALR